MKKTSSCLVLLAAVLVANVKCNSDDNVYSLMPELFYMDNFDQCMLGQNKSLFCTFTFSLKPLGDTTNIIWQIIANTSSNPQNYKHDRLRYGICVTQTCGDNYNVNVTIDEFIQLCYNKKFRDINLEGTVSQVVCQNNTTTYPIDVYDIIFGACILIYLMFILFASIYERYIINNNKLTFYEKGLTKGALFIAAFSIPRNWHRLRSTSSDPYHRKLRSIQGMRFYNMICVIMSHTVMNILGGPVANPLYTENSTKHILNMFLANGWYVVQTFFVISGWLLSYHFFDALNRFKPVYFVWSIIHRYIRLVPAVIFMVGLHATWLVQTSRGPNWDVFVGQEYRNCRKNWWTNVLFVNNYIDNNNMCLHQTWYIAADMQLFIMSIIPLYIIWKYPARLKQIFGVLLFTGLISPGIVAYVNNYDIVIRQYPEVLYNLNLLKLDHWHQLYSSAYTNIFGYTIGMVFGYLFYRYRDSQLHFHPVYRICWWILTFGMCIFMVLLAIIFYDPTFPVTPLRSALYWSLGKNLFALGIAIGIFGMTQKIGWFARRCCEFSPLQVLGRLTYSTYIVHTAFIRWQMGYRRYPASANDTMIFIAVLGDVTCSYLAGTVLCLLLEMPISSLQKMFGFGPSKTRTTTIKKSSEKSLETLDMTNS